MDKILGIIRHILTFVAGILVSRGIIDESMVQEFIALIIGLIGLIWSIVDKNNRDKIT